MPRQLADELAWGYAVSLPQANAVETGDVTDTGGQLDADISLQCDALTSVQLPNGATITIAADLSDSPAMSAAEEYPLTVLTGANNAGCPVLDYRFALPSTAKRYMRLRLVGSGNGDCQAVPMLVRAIF